MNLSPVSNLNFKGYVPVTYYALDGNGKTSSRVTSKENLRKCNGKIVRNLNGTLKEVNKDLVDYFKKYDKDYQKLPYVTSIYDYETSTVYLVTGCDAYEVDNMAKPIGIAKSEALARTGKSRSYESNSASREFFKNARSYLQHRCTRLKSKEGQNLSLQVLFKPVYKKDGALKDFKYQEMEFVGK